MSDAPEQIWAVTEPDDISAQILGEVYAQQTPDGFVGKPTEYVRKDLSDAAIAAVKREAFNEGIEAAAMCGDKAIHGYAGRCLKGDRYALGVQAGVERFSRAIRTLLKEGTDK